MIKTQKSIEYYGVNPLSFVIFYLSKNKHAAK